MHRTWIVLGVALAVGSHAFGQAEPVRKPRQDETPRPRHEGLIELPSVIKNLRIPPDNGPKRQPESRPVPINAAQAIKIAEQFVRDNGYTDFEPLDASKLVGESFEGLERKDWIARRHNSLRPRALGYFEGAKNDPKGWTVGFENVEPSDKKHGRAVTMDANGRNVRMQHLDLILKFLRPRPE